MTESLDHDACSALLRAYVSGEAGKDSAAIAAHLEVCAECRAEHAGLERLLAPVDPLSASERARLRDGVLAATRAPRDRSTPTMESMATARSASRPPTIPAQKSSRRPSSVRRFERLAPALSAAAMVLLVVAGSVFVFQHLGTSSQGSASGVNAPQGNAAEPNDGTGPGRNTGKGGGVIGSLPVPQFASAPLSGNGNTSITDGAPPPQADRVVTAFAHAYRGSQADRLASNFLTRLVATAPETLRAQVRQCGQRVLTAADAPLLPAYGAATEIQNRQGLLLVFARATSPEQPFTTLELDAWPGGSCAGEPIQRLEAIAP